MISDWQPILEGRDERAARQVISFVQEKAAPLLAGAKAPGLASGHAGLLLLQMYAEASLIDPRAIARLLRAIERDALGPGLYAGVAGLAWALSHALSSARNAAVAWEVSPTDEYEELALVVLNEPAVADDLLTQVDDALHRFVEDSRPPAEVDLVNGMVGIGIYALERCRRANTYMLLGAVVDQLAMAARTDGGRTRWFTPHEILHRRQAAHPMGYYDFGVAHGLPGIISLLTSARSAGVRVALATELLSGAVQELLSVANENFHPSRIPSYVYANGTATPARLAWCYGDPGGAAVLLRAAKECDRSDWEDAALELALSSTVADISHAPPEVTGVVDACLCHGTAGIAHSLNRMYQVSGDKILRSSSIDWFRRTIEIGLSSPDQGVGGYTTFYPTPDGDEWRNEAGFLEGASGIALALAAAIGNRAPDWDCILCLSSPTDSHRRDSFNARV